MNCHANERMSPTDSEVTAMHLAQHKNSTMAKLIAQYLSFEFNLLVTNRLDDKGWNSQGKKTKSNFSCPNCFSPTDPNCLMAIFFIFVTNLLTLHQSTLLMHKLLSGY